MPFEELHNFACNGPFIEMSGRTFDATLLSAREMDVDAVAIA